MKCIINGAVMKLSFTLMLFALGSLNWLAHTAPSRLGRCATLVRALSKTTVSDMWYNVKNNRSPVHQFQHKTIEKYELGSSKNITITHGLGNVQVEGWDDPRINIQTNKQSHHADAFNKTRVLTEFTDKTANIKTEYFGRVGKETPALKTGKNSRINWRDVKPADVSAMVDLRIQTPQDSNITVSTLRGKIHIKNIRGKVHATTLADTITTEKCQAVQAQSKTGNISIKDNQGPVKASSAGIVQVNGHEAHSIVWE